MENDKEFEEFEKEVQRGKLELEALIASNYIEAEELRRNIDEEWDW